MRNIVSTHTLAARAAAVLAADAFCTVALAVAAQVRYDWQPCPWCILQRYAYLILGLVLTARAFAPAKGRAATWLSGAAALVALSGIGLAMRQVIFMVWPSDTCGRDALAMAINALPTAKHLPTVFLATGSCADPIPLSFPILSLTGFVVLAVLTLKLLRVTRLR